MEPFADRLFRRVREKRSPVVVGLDPRLGSLPKHLRVAALAEHGPSATAIAEVFVTFFERVLDRVAPLVPAVKPQLAFFEQYGPEGFRALSTITSYARGKGLLVIADAKRNDIGPTMSAYADAYLGTPEFWEGVTFAPFQADAMTVNPYFGSDGVEPALESARNHGAGVFVLVKTSNPSSRELQDQLMLDGRPLYERVAELVSKWGEPLRGSAGYSSVGAVVGATFPSEAERLRELMPATPFLVPGYGAQGAMARDVVSAFDSAGLGAVVVSARDIIFAFSKPPWNSRFREEEFDLAAEAAVLQMRRDIEEALLATGRSWDR